MAKMWMLYILVVIKIRGSGYGWNEIGQSGNGQSCCGWSVCGQNENGWRWIRRSRCQRIGYGKKWELDELDLEEMGMDIRLIPLDHVTYYIQPEIKQSSIIIILILFYIMVTLLKNTSGDQCWTEVSKINHWTCRRNFVSRTDFNHFICYAMINEFCQFLNSRRLYNILFNKCVLSDSTSFVSNTTMTYFHLGSQIINPLSNQRPWWPGPIQHSKL